MTWSLHTTRSTFLPAELRYCAVAVEDVRARACDYAFLCFTPKAW